MVDDRRAVSVSGYSPSSPSKMLGPTPHLYPLSRINRGNSPSLTRCAHLHRHPTNAAVPATTHKAARR